MGVNTLLVTICTVELGSVMPNACSVLTTVSTDIIRIAATVEALITDSSHSTQFIATMGEKTRKPRSYVAF